MAQLPCEFRVPSPRARIRLLKLRINGQQTGSEPYYVIDRAASNGQQ